MKFDAVIFDLDGTLVDTESLTMAAGIKAFSEHGIAIETALLHGLIGKDDETGAGIIRANFPDLDYAAFNASWGDAVQRLQSAGLPLKSGAYELLEIIKIPKALATSSTRHQADRKLALTGLGGFFLHVITFDDVAYAKPAPDPFLRAAELLGADPARCLVFEDSEPGAASAFAAGMTVVQIPDIVPASGRFAHLVAEDLMSGARKIGLLAN